MREKGRKRDRERKRGSNDEKITFGLRPVNKEWESKLLLIRTGSNILILLKKMRRELNLGSNDDSDDHASHHAMYSLSSQRKANIQV